MRTDCTPPGEGPKELGETLKELHSPRGQSGWLWEVLEGPLGGNKHIKPEPSWRSRLDEGNQGPVKPGDGQWRGEAELWMVSDTGLDPELGPDCICHYWLKHFKCTTEALKVGVNTRDVWGWLVKGQTILIPKVDNATNPSSSGWSPDTCSSQVHWSRLSCS